MQVFDKNKDFGTFIPNTCENTNFIKPMDTKHILNKCVNTFYFNFFRDFLKICYTALQINSKLITSDQCEYQEALRANYKKLCIQLSTLFGEALWPHDETGSFKRNSLALFSAISGASYNSSTA